MNTRALLCVLVSLLAHASALAAQLDHNSVPVCALVLTGHNNSSNVSSSGSSSTTTSPRTPSVAYASLHCTAGHGGNLQDAVRVAINSTYLDWHAANFTGVTVVPGSSCQQHSGDTATYALLQFCGNYSLLLVQPVVSHVWLPGNGGEGWSSAVVAFGGAVTAEVSAGQFIGNAATHVLVTQGTAKVPVSESLFSSNTGSVAAAGASTLHILGSIITSNRAVIGAAVHVSGAANLSINSSILSNSSGDNGPALLGEGNSTLGIFHSLISNHTSTAPISSTTDVDNGAAVYVKESCQLIVAHSTFTNNWSRRHGYGGAMRLAGRTSTSVSNSTFVANVGGFGAAIFMQGVRLTVTDSEFRDNEGFEGGVAHVKEDTQVRTTAVNAVAVALHQIMLPAGCLFAVTAHRRCCSAQAAFCCQ